MHTKKPTDIINDNIFLRPWTDSDNDINTVQQVEDWPRFLIIHSTDDENNLSKLSPFAVHKGIEGIAGIPKDIKRLRSGDFLLEVNREGHANNLLKITHLVKIQVTVFPHKALNSSVT